MGVPAEGAPRDDAPTGPVPVLTGRRVVAYNSDESAPGSVCCPVSIHERSEAGVERRGCQPIWRKDGKELFYIALDAR